MRIVHVIIGLGDGGAERSLYKLVTTDVSNEHIVLSLTTMGKYGPLLSDRGISVIAVRWKFWTSLSSVLALLRRLRAIRPRILHGWMPHGALFASVLQNWTGAKRVIWSIRASQYGVGKGTRLTRLIVRILAWLSHTVPSRILVVGNRALENHVAAGFNPDRIICIPNGYIPQTLREGDRVEGNIKSSTSALNRKVTKFGTVARHHKKKGHKMLLEAFAELKNSHSNWTLSLVGEGVSENNQDLVADIARLGLADHVILVGPVDEPADVYKMLDFHVLPSLYGEGFPNVVAESMLAGTLNIVTDVGDSAEIVGDTGWVVPANDKNSLANALEAALVTAPSERRKQGIRAHERISKEYSLERMVESHVREYDRRNLVCYPRYSQLGASSRVRMFQFEDAIADSGWDVSLFPFSSDYFLRSRYEGRKAWLGAFLSYGQRILDLRKSRKADLVWIQRELIPLAPAWLENLLAPHRTPVIYDFDDAVYEQFRESPRAIIRAALGEKIVRTVGKSAGVVAGNRVLANFFTTETETPCVLIPSTIDTTELRQADQPLRGEKYPFVFGWIGTPLTFQAYVEKMLGEFDSIAKKIEGEFWVIGAGVPELSTAHVKYFPWSKETENQLLQSIDVGVMPLSDDPWSRGKCGYKLLQYMALGKPALASPVGVNTDIVKHGENGFLVKEPGDWGRYLRTLAEDRGLASAMGKKAANVVVKSFSLESNAPKVLRFLRDSAGA